MDIFEVIAERQKPLHHAFLFVGKEETLLARLAQALTKRGIEIKGNPDYTFQKYDSVLIEDALALRERASTKAFSSGEQFFVLSFLSFTREAQSALLKMLEEPHEAIHFFFITPSAEYLFDTVKSRMLIYTFEETPEVSKDVEVFVSNPLALRFGFIKSFIDSFEDDETSGGKREGARVFLNMLESVLSKREDRARYASVLKDIIVMREHINERGAQVKMILEHIALSLPE